MQTQPNAFKSTDEDKAAFRERVIDPKAKSMERFRVECPGAYDRLQHDLIDKRKAAKVKKAAARAITSLIFTMYTNGATLQEIGAALGKTPDATREAARSRGLLLSFRAAARRVPVFIPLELVGALDRLVADHGSTRDGALEDLFHFLLSDDAQIARRLMRVKRRATA